MAKNADAVDAILHEYDFVSSVVPLYRGYQLRIVAFGLLVYGAIGALLGNALRTSGGDDLMLTVVALLPWFQLALVGALLMSELRIVRASHYLTKELYPRVFGLVDQEVMGFELRPSKYLKPHERALSTSLSRFIILAAPALVGAFLYVFRDIDRPISVGVPLIGAVALAGMTWAGIRTTVRHESR
jgi:hypothetical protein